MANGIQHDAANIKFRPLPNLTGRTKCQKLGGRPVVIDETAILDGKNPVHDQGRALSAHNSLAYEGYATRTMERALAATHAHRLANAAGTDVHNEPQIRGQNEIGDTYREAK